MITHRLTFWRRKNKTLKTGAFFPALIHATEYARVCGDGYVLISRRIDDAGEEFFTYQAIPPTHVVILT